MALNQADDIDKSQQGWIYSHIILLCHPFLLQAWICSGLLISKILKPRPPKSPSLPIAKVIESPELKALELFIAEKNSEILCRFDGLLQQQQLLSTKQKNTRIFSSSS